MKIEKLLGVAVLALGVLLGSVDEGFANGFRNPPESARALGQAGSQRTFIDDASALSHNPANLVGVERPSVMASLAMINARADFDGIDGRSGNTTDPVKWLPHIHAAWPIEDNLVAAVGVTTPFGQSTEWHRDGPFELSAPYLAEMTTVNIAPGVATRVGDTLSVGVALNVYWSELDLRQSMPWSLLTGFPGAPDGTAQLEGDGWAVGARAGMTWQFSPKQRVSLVYVSPFDVDYEGSTRVSNIPPPAGGLVAERSDFDSTIKFPSIVAFGYGVELTDKIRVGVDVEWLEFSRFDELPLDLGANNAAGLTLPSIPQDWDDTWTIGVGGDWAITEPWTVRAGYLFMESPIPAETLAPTLPDADRHLLTTGLTYERGDNAIDLAFAYSIFDDAPARSDVIPAYSGDYDLSSHIVQLSYRRSF